jgi:hypothetical protein
MEKTKTLRNDARQAELVERKTTTILLNHAGGRARKNPGAGEVFFLDIPYQNLPDT